MKTFDSEYTLAANAGITDGIGGSEYRNIKQAWIEAGAPLDVLTFITTWQHGNVMLFNSSSNAGFFNRLLRIG